MEIKTYHLTQIAISLFSLILFISTTVHAKIIYVDADATGSNNGSSWADAYNDLQDAIAVAWSGDEIRIAHGVYNPDQGVGITSGDRTASFQLKDGLTLKGGYAGFGEPDSNARDIEVYETVLSGDLAGNDVDVNDLCDLLTEPSRAENSYHVVNGGWTGTGVLDGFTIIAGNANDTSYSKRSGAGIANYNGWIKNCTITRNSAEDNGGGVWAWGLRLTNCTIFRNFAAHWGGGIAIEWCDESQIRNCIISGNTAGGAGGGMYMGDSDATLINCVFSGNSAKDAGGLCLDISDGWTNAWLINCTFSGNSAEENGGGIGIIDVDCSAVLTNCIFWGNSDFTGACESAQIHAFTQKPIVNYSCMQGWSGDLGGTGNINADPLFVDADGPDNIFGTQDDNLRLLAGSPCEDAGDNLFGIDPKDFKVLPVLYDLAGNPRIINRTVDMGAYEGPNQGFLLNTKSIIVPEGGVATFTVALAMDPEGTVDVTVTVESGDPDIVIQSGATLTFKSCNYSHPQIVTLAAAEDDGYLNGTAIIEVSAAWFFIVRLSVSEWDNDAPTILYVDGSAKGAERGTSWANAFTDLQDALSMAEIIPQIEEILVAQGLYTPAGPAGDRRETFQLINGVTIKGGYAGSCHPKPNTRNIHMYKTILSGDLNGDDGPDFTNNTENSYHVVTGTLTDETSILDGFTITGGNANGPYSKHDRGGGMYNDYGSLTLTNCTFNANSAGFGGGLYNIRRSSPTMIKCTFSYNLASSGGGMYNDECKPRLSNCVFRGNSANFNGGGMYNRNNPSSPELTNCLFAANLATSGGGMFNWYGMPRLTNCTYTGNSATYRGGGMWNNTWFGRYMPVLTNCILWANTDSTNLYESAQIYGGGIVNYSCIQGWQGALGGIGNIGGDPCFVTPGYWDANELWVDGDYRLLEDSPCINAGDPNYVVGPDETDLEGKPRILLGRIDMGVYEYSPPIATKVKIVPRIINLASEGKWVDCYIWPPEEYNVADIDLNSILLRGKLEPQELRIDEERQVAIVRFNRPEVQGFLNVGRFDIIIFGQLTDGTVFAGADTIRVIDKGDKK